jgi:hypothetical protein
MINFNWKFPAMECKNDGDLEKIIIVIHWILEAEKNGFNSNVYGMASLDLPSSKNFIPYEQLTKKQVIAWVGSVLNVQEIKENLEKKIDELKKPKNEILQAPFEN